MAGDLTFEIVKTQKLKEIYKLNSDTRRKQEDIRHVKGTIVGVQGLQREELNSSH